jgi:hypothetical protein
MEYHENVRWELLYYMQTHGLANTNMLPASTRNCFASASKEDTTDSTVFYVMLTAHLDMILVNNQLDAQLFFSICLLQFSTCFEQPRAHHQENQLYQYNIWYVSLCVGDRLVCRSGRNFPTAY